MKNSKFISLLLMMIMLLSSFGLSTTQAASIQHLFGQDSIGFHNSPTAVAESMIGTNLVTQSTSLPTINGFWTDLVDTEHVSNDGSGVYVAVLDTGLLQQWPFFFSQATIRDDLGIGFSHDITWDNSINDIVIGPLRSDRGFITGDESGHGTHVTSTIVGYNYNDIAWVNGVAPKVQIIPVLVLDAWTVDTPFGPIQLNGGTDEMIAAGITYVANLAASLDGPVVINLDIIGFTFVVDLGMTITNYSSGKVMISSRFKTLISNLIIS